MKMLPAAVLCISLAGCTAPVEQTELPEIVRAATREEQTEALGKQPDPSEDMCPPLPAIPDGASKFQGRLFTLTLIALYEQCARSKK